MIGLAEYQTRSKRNIKYKQLDVIVEQDAMLLSSPLLNGSTVVLPLKMSIVDDEREKAPAGLPAVELPLGLNSDAVSFPVMAWVLFNSTFCGTLAVFGSGSMVSMSELVIEGGGRGSAIVLEDPRGADMAVGVDASRVVEASMNIGGFVPIDAGEGIEGSDLSSEIHFDDVEVDDVNGSDIVWAMMLRPVEPTETNGSGFPSRDDCEATVPLEDKPSFVFEECGELCGWCSP